MPQTEDLYKIFSSASGISTDSRNITENSLFFALKGERFDGNRFAGQAIEQGACAAVIDDPPTKKDSRYFLVTDVLDSLQQLARFHREKLKAKVFAITGSNGKTTTKELVSSVLGSKMNVISTVGNLNNHIGVPLTLLDIHSNTDLAVVEMGANHLGEIASLCSIALPDFGLITNIGRAHLEGFGSFPNIIRAKAELYNWLRKTGGIIFQNSRSPVLKGISQKTDHVIEYGTSKDGEFELRPIKSDPYLWVEYIDNHSRFTIHTQLFGSYNLENIEAAFTVGLHFNLDPLAIKKALEAYQPENFRSQVIVTKRNQVFADTYNANPSSMRLAIHEFLEVSGQKKMVILGDMLELGEQARKEHEAIVSSLVNISNLRIVLIGPIFSKVSGGTGIMHFAKTQEAVTYFMKEQVHSYQILLKGSRLMRLEQLLTCL